MKRLLAAALVCATCAGITCTTGVTASSNDSSFYYTSSYATNLMTEWYGELPSIGDSHVAPSTVVAPAGVCDPGTANLVVHDDGVGENGYGWSPVAGTDGRYADKFTPAAYPATIRTVCASFITNTGATAFDMSVAVYADDGADGRPGTLLGSKDFVAHPEAISGLPFTPIFETFDITDLGIEIAAGSVYISVNWNAETVPSGVFIGVDESLSTPLAGGYSYTIDNDWIPLGSVAGNQSGYRALLIRAVMPESGDDIFCNGFENNENGACSNIVASGPINHAVAQNVDGTSVDWITGDIQDADVSGYHFNPYFNGNRLTFWWGTGAPGIAGVSSAADVSNFLVLQSGDRVGPSSVWSTVSNPGPAAWSAGADGYLGFRFNCSGLPQPPASGICYGYVHLQTTAPAGFPATIVDYAYDSRGKSIRIP